MRKPRTLFFSAGEPSGDLHAANLIRQLRQAAPEVDAVGYGGPQMAAAGCRLHADLTALAVMWFARALWNLPKFWDLVSRADRYFRHHRPDAVVLVDYPGFNWWIARRAKVHGIPVFYYMPPQIWAWAQWRVAKMRRLVDHVLCNLPFEERWFRGHGCRATLVGHPFFDEVGRRPLDGRFLAQQRSRPGPLVLILPGSRTQEVSHNLPWFWKAAAQVRRAVPAARFAVGAFREDQAELVRRMAGKLANGAAAPFSPADVYVGKAPELMHLADCCMACSGSVSLELLHHATPTVILYWISRTAYFVQGFFRKAKYITLVNLLAGDGRGEEIFPEYLTCEDRSADIARHVIEWLSDAAKRQRRVAELQRLRAEVARSGAAAAAAGYVLEGLGIRD
jgi:lipid-A-disaccharide synthase